MINEQSLHLYLKNLMSVLNVLDLLTILNFAGLP
jgi:hypothetical protein